MKVSKINIKLMPERNDKMINTKTDETNNSKNCKTDNADTEELNHFKIEISDEGKQKSQNIYQITQDHLDNLRKQIIDSDKAIKNEADANKIRIKCQIIARRIAKGDKVPKEDYRFLLKNSPGMYMKAVSLRVPNDKPKRHKRLSEEENPMDEAKKMAKSLADMLRDETPVYKNAEISSDSEE